MDEIDKKSQKLLDEARERFNRAQEKEQDNRERAQEDFAFAAGEQWPDEIRRERERDGRPCLTINRLPQFIAQVVNDARQNKPSIKIRPRDANGSEETAKVYEGLVRQIESASRAEHSYITGLEHAATGGFGAWRVLTEYADDSEWAQDIRIKRIINPFSVSWDENATEYDRSDAMWCFVTEWITKKAFGIRYPKNTPQNWEAAYRSEDAMHWIDDDYVRICEYWLRESVNKKLGLTQDGKTVPMSDEKGVAIEYPQGYITKDRTAKTHKVTRYLLSGHAILEGPKEWAGKYIPIIPIYGPEEYIEGEIRYRSVIRYSKDPMRQYNYWQSQITEKIALAPRAPFVGTAKMFEGYEDMWETANTENYAYLPFNGDPSVGGMRPERQAPAQLNQAELAQSETAIEDLKATTGIYDASLGNRSNETSGRAIIARQREGDTSTFGWIDNLSRSIEHTGRILVDLIPRIYDTERTLRIEGDDGKAEFVPINTYARDENGDPVLVHDLSAGKYDVEVDTGPSFATRRQESAESMLQFVQAYPAAAPVIGDLLAKNMDWPGADTIAERLAKLLPPGMDPDQPPPPPNPMEQMQLEKAKLDLEKEKVNIQQIMMDMRKTMAEAQKIHAQTQTEMTQGEKEMDTAYLDHEGKELSNAKAEVDLASSTGQLQQVVAQEVARLLQQYRQ